MQYQLDELIGKIVPNGAMHTHRITLTNTITRLGTVHDRKRLYVVHSGPGVVFIGNDTLTGTPNGFPIPSGSMTPIPIGSDIVVFGWATSSTPVSILELV